MLRIFLRGGRVAFGAKIADYESRLAPVAGFTGHGELDYAAWRNGAKVLEVELRGLAGREAELFVNGTRFRSIPIHNGRADEIFETGLGDPVPDIHEGDTVEIRQNGQPVLTGTMRED